MSPDSPGVPLQPGWERGKVSFSNALAIPHNGGSWKQDLSNKYRGATGKELSRALLAHGYDGVITQDKYGIVEIADVRPKGHRGHKRR
jgi:hypothetical protein